MITVTSNLKYNPKIAEDTSMMIVRAMDRMSAFARRVAVQNAPKDTGQLINSINIIREYDPPSFLGGIRTNLPHAIVMEEGRRPGAPLPPFLPIYRWVVRHRKSFGLGPRKRSGVVKMTKAAREHLKQKDEDKLKQLTNAIRWKIHKVGIEGKKFFAKAEQAVRAEFDREIRILGLDIKKAWDLGG